MPAPHPEAELWMGAHPDDPSRVVGADGVERTLLEAWWTRTRSASSATRAPRRWDNRLPFLLKVLAADEPMSMQAHPSAAQARRVSPRGGRSASRGPPRTATTRTRRPSRNWCARSPSSTCWPGSATRQRTVELLHGARRARPVDRYASLLAGQPDADGLRALFTTLDHAAAAGHWTTCCRRCWTRACCTCKEHGPFDLECRTVLELGEPYPGDVGVLAALLLNRLVLGPGEAVYLSPGSLHAYLRGTAVEILANSDNILRCGLTPKHVDVPELLRVLDFGARRHAGAAR